MALFQSDFLKNSFNFKIHVNSDFWFTNVRRKHQLSELSAIPSKFLISATELTETSYSINSTCLRRVRRCVKRGKKIRWIYFTRKMSVFKKTRQIKALSTIILGSLEDAGKDCLHKCHKQGKCDWCSADGGWCCRKGEKYTGNGCDGSIGGLDNHLCVYKPSM